MKTVLDNLKETHRLLRALDNEPLHSPFIMSRMAVAAEEGGAEGFAPTAWRTLLPLNSWFHCR